MPAKSKAQLKFMGAVAGGAANAKGLSKEKAKEFIKSTKDKKKLPQKKSTKH